MATCVVCGGGEILVRIELTKVLLIDRLLLCGFYVLGGIPQLSILLLLEQPITRRVVPCGTLRFARQYRLTAYRSPCF